MTEPLNILVVEDDAELREAVSLTLECAGHRVQVAANGPEALRLIDEGSFSLVVSDLKMAPMDGLTLLREIRAREPYLPVLLMTAYGEIDTAVAAMRGGACDFLQKPFEPDVLLDHVDRYAVPPAPDDGVVGEDPRTRSMLALAARVARSDATVLLTGESGTGKEVYARYIHAQSARAAAPFVAINCAAIPDHLLEATLFGHEKGAFTGAQTAQAGKFEQAQGGTLLLDEISEMPLALQAKLLRVLQEREVERVGGRKAISLDIRVLATSNRDMLGEVARGRFREDLYYRLAVFPLPIPALRERPQDIAPLVRHFLGRHGGKNGKAARLAAEAEAILAAYRWPGNVRELENVMQRLMIVAAGDTIMADDVRLCLPSLTGSVAVSPAPSDDAFMPAPAPKEAENGEKPANMKDLEREHILATLAAVGGSRKLAVERLGISERTLRYKLQQYRAEGHAVD